MLHVLLFLLSEEHVSVFEMRPQLYSAFADFDSRVITTIRTSLSLYILLMSLVLGISHSLAFKILDNLLHTILNSLKCSCTIILGPGVVINREITYSIL